MGCPAIKINGDVCGNFSCGGVLCARHADFNRQKPLKLQDGTTLGPTHLGQVLRRECDQCGKYLMPKSAVLRLSQRYLL